MNDIRPLLTHPRYTDEPWPPYRYVPGRHPHPTAHPDGHSYGTHAAAPPPPIEESAWPTCRPYLIGCDCYNHGYWWEAHEEWEAQWRVAGRESLQGHFLQGLIQVSACHLLIFQGDEAGVGRLRRTSLEYLVAVLTHWHKETYMGIPLADFVKRATDYFERYAQPSWIHDERSYPYITLLT